MSKDGKNFEKRVKTGLKLFRGEVITKSSFWTLEFEGFVQCNVHLQSIMSYSLICLKFYDINICFDVFINAGCILHYYVYEVI